MIWKNSCLKCGGNVILERDAHGWYEQCLQCSYMKDLKVIYQEQATKPVPAKEFRRPAGIA